MISTTELQVGTQSDRIRGLTLVGLEVLDCSNVSWETFCLASALTGAVSGGLSGPRPSSDVSTGPGGSFWIS